MKLLIIPPCLLAAACLVGCVPPQGYHRAPGSLVTVPDDPCIARAVNSERSLSWINSSVGRPRGLSQTVVSMSGTKDAASSDLALFKLPGTGTALEHPAAFACYATAHFQDGTTQDGIIHVTAPENSIFSPAPNQSLQVVWLPRETVEQARASDDARWRQRQGDDQKAIAYSQALQSCTFEWKIAVSARAGMKSGWTEAMTAEHLVTSYAYGPDGQVYRGSHGTEEMIRQVTAAVAMSPEQRASRGLPDYASQQFLDGCSKTERQQSR